jgi:hypothetical protein
LLNTPTDGFGKGGSGNGKPPTKTHPKPTKNAMAPQKGAPTDLVSRRKHLPTKVWYFPETKNLTNKSREERCTEEQEA